MARLTYKQKLKNKQIYKRIREGYNQVKGKNEDISYKQFKNRVMARMEIDKNLKLKDAIKKVQRSEAYLPAEERSKQNLISGIKRKFEDRYKLIMKLNRDEYGRYKKIDLTYREFGEKYGYTFTGGGKTYFIDLTPSPDDVLIYEI